MTRKNQLKREKRIREALSFEPVQGFVQGVSVTHGLLHGADMLDTNSTLGKVGFAAPISGSPHVKALVGIS